MAVVNQIDVQLVPTSTHRKTENVQYFIEDITDYHLLKLERVTTFIKRVNSVIKDTLKNNMTKFNYHSLIKVAEKTKDPRIMDRWPSRIVSLIFLMFIELYRLKDKEL